MDEAREVEENEGEDKSTDDITSEPPAAKRRQKQQEGAATEGERSEAAQYTCASCDFATSSRNLLKKHRTAKHGQLAEAAAKAAQCGLCGYKCRNDRVLQIHSRKMHAVMN